LEQAERNHPSRFWRIADPRFSDEDWENAYRLVVGKIFAFEGSLLNYISWLLMEQQFDSEHWTLSHSMRLFYRLKPFIPRSIQIQLRQIYRLYQERKVTIHWPIEDRYVRFQCELVRRLMENKDLSEVPYISFWPKRKDFAFVLTHDVETEEGFKNIPKVVELEKQYSFRSVFNIVPERYPIDIVYLNKLRAEGFEIGIHGLKHDGELFLSKKTFLSRVKKINKYIKDYGAKGFRSPFTHRNPLWMHELECDYDMSFFDTDPYETMPGGTLSIWPFFIVHFVELPYTLPQDSTLFIIRKEKNINIWREKINFIEKKKGMALLNVHPDYIDFENKWGRKKYPLRLYEEFLSHIRNKRNYWHALPKDVAKWWGSRAERILISIKGQWKIYPPLDGANIRKINLEKGKLIFN